MNDPSREENYNGNSWQPQMPNNYDNMNQPQMQQMPNNYGNMNQPQMQQMPNNYGDMNQPQMQQMPNNYGNMNQPQMQQMPNKKNNKIPLIIVGVIIVLLIAFLIFVVGGQKRLHCSQSDANSTVTFNLTFKNNTLRGGNVDIIYDLSNASQSEINTIKSIDLCSGLTSSASYNIRKCDTKFTDNSLRVSAKIESNENTSLENLKSNLTSQGFTCN